MKTVVAFAALLVAAPAFAQTSVPATAAQAAAQGAAARPASSVTRNLNSAPAAAVTPTPAPLPATPAQASPAAASRPAATTTTPVPTAAAPAGAARVTPPPAAASVAPAAPAAEPAPAPPPMTVLNATAVAALPFTVQLPAGFTVTTGRPGPDFKIYTIRRGEQSFVTVYAGPSSMFPIYTGETVQAGGRASIVTVDQAGQRHAPEHLFQRPTAPREIHVWIASLEGADQALAEQIAQSVDDR